MNTALLIWRQGVVLQRRNRYPAAFEAWQQFINPTPKGKRKPRYVQV